MQTNPIISTHKIVIFVVFVSMAIMTSLFIFHLSQKPKQTNLSPNDGILFSVARDIKPFELTTMNQKKFTQKDFLGHWTLLFFGFTHCSTICPTTLDMLARTYAKLHTTYSNLQVVLISLDPERDTPETLAAYVHNYHPSFMGVTGKISELHKLQSQLGIFSARDASASHPNYQIQHTPSILLINPQGKWAGSFKSGMSPDHFAKAFIDSLSYA